MEEGPVQAGRYEIRKATILDLITIAYGVGRDAVVGGPKGLDWNRFEIVAKVPPSTRPENVKLMLQSLLAERFQLRVHREQRLTPVYAMVLPGNSPKFRPSAPVASPMGHMAVDAGGTFGLWCKLRSTGRSARLRLADELR